jgi:hypothetical protein
MPAECIDRNETQTHTMVSFVDYRTAVSGQAIRFLLVYNLVTLIMGKAIGHSLNVSDKWDKKDRR